MKRFLLIVAAISAATLSAPAFARGEHHRGGYGGGHDRGSHGGVSIRLGGGYSGGYRAPVYVPQARYYDDSYYYGAQPYRQQRHYDHDRYDRRAYRHDRHGYDRHSRRGYDKAPASAMGIVASTIQVARRRSGSANSRRLIADTDPTARRRTSRQK